MRITILTLFPDVVRAYLGVSILKIASEKGLAHYEVVSFRDHAEGKHRQVDDRPFGGGPGMVLMPGPVVAAVEAARKDHGPETPTVLLTPQGEPFHQRMAEELAAGPGMILVSGRYEGFDERIRQVLKPKEVSLGDFVLSGGELFSMSLWTIASSDIGNWASK